MPGNPEYREKTTFDSYNGRGEKEERLRGFVESNRVDQDSFFTLFSNF